MPLYLRKSVRAGPFRFNLSKSGIGASVGIKGLRIGTGPRGHYISAGRGGLRYRASINPTPQSKNLRPVSPERPAAVTTYVSDVEMIEVDSGSVLEMRDEAFGAILDDINACSRKSRLAVVVPILTAALVLGINYALGIGVADIILVVPAWIFGQWLDSYRRTTVMHYDLADGTESTFKKITEAFDEMVDCDGAWHIEAGGVVRDITTWKRNAGASHIVKKKSTTLSYKLPKVVKSNITPPALHVGRQIIYFFPDVALIQDGDRFGAVGYADLKISYQDSNFIETGRVPRDAKVIDYTWEHPNKSGGPDRRYKNNRQLPVCRYEAMHLSSATGVNELVEFSRTGVAHAFATATGLLPKQSLPNTVIALPTK